MLIAHASITGILTYVLVVGAAVAIHVTDLAGFIFGRLWKVSRIIYFGSGEA